MQHCVRLRWKHRDLHLEQPTSRTNFSTIWKRRRRSSSRRTHTQHRRDFAHQAYSVSARRRSARSQSAKVEEQKFRWCCSHTYASNKPLGRTSGRLALRDFAEDEEDDRKYKGGRDKDGVMQRPPRQRVLTVHLGLGCCSCAVTYVVPKSDNLMVTTEVPCTCVDESVAPPPDGRCGLTSCKIDI